MGKAKWQPAQCWNERRVNLIDKHRWRLNLTTLRSYLTTCCSLLRSPPSSSCLAFGLCSLSFSLLLSLYFSLLLPLFFLHLSADRNGTFLFAGSALQNCNHWPNEVSLARRTKRANERTNAANRANETNRREGGRERENWKREPSGTGIEPISGGRLEVYLRECARARNISCALGALLPRAPLRILKHRNRACIADSTAELSPASID